MRLRNFTQTEKDVFPSCQWTKVKKEVLAGAFGVQSPGFMVTNCDFNFIGDCHLLNSGPITIHKIDRSLEDDEWEEAVFFVFKEKWSRTELNGTLYGLQYDEDFLWMLPNIDKMPPEEIARESWTSDDLSACEPLDCNLILSKIKGLEAIGGFYNGGNSLLWTNPSSPKQIDLVVKNLNQLCLDLKVELREI